MELSREIYRNVGHGAATHGPHICLDPGCGDPVRKLGNEYLYQSQATENVEVIQGYDVKKVVTTCPHCFNTLAKDIAEILVERLA